MGLHQNEGVGQTFRAAATLPQWRLIEPAGVAADGTVTANLCGTTPTGPVMQNAKDALVVGDLATGVRLTHYSTYNLVADGNAINIGDEVKHAAAGKVSSAGAGTAIGVATSATTGGDGEFVTVMPY